MPQKIVSLIGARPQFVKAAVVSEQIARHPELTECLVHSGQHYDYQMSNVFFDELSIPTPTHHLAIGSGSHGAQTASILSAFEDVLLTERPDWVLVYGDTNTTVAGALAATKLHIKLAHVESGLRSFNRRMPEEINRIATDSISDLLFAPSDQAAKRLLFEGQPAERVVNAGDVMFDAVLRFADLARNQPDLAGSLGHEPKQFALATIHRAENTDTPETLVNLMSELNALAADLPVIMPLHPRTEQALKRLSQDHDHYPNVDFIEPVGYLQMLRLEQDAKLVVTDSGGVQKEAFFNGVPCVTARSETEWTELVEGGWNHLADPAKSGGIRAAAQTALETTPTPLQCYGTGAAAAEIAQHLASR